MWVHTHLILLLALFGFCCVRYVWGFSRYWGLFVYFMFNKGKEAPITLGPTLTVALWIPTHNTCSMLYVSALKH